MNGPPPRLARLLLRVWLRGDAYEVIAGDLAEGMATQRFPSPRAARRWYWRATVGSTLGRLRHADRFPLFLPLDFRIMNLDSFLLDLRFSLRSYRRSAPLTAIVVGTLAIGIGSSVAMFSIVDAALLSPLPYPEPDRLVALYEQDTLNAREASWSQASPANYLSWRERSATIERSTAHGWVTGWAFSGAARPEWVRGVSIYADFFKTFGRPMTLGRGPSESEIWDLERVVVISHGLWARAFASDPDVIGKPIVLDDIERRIIGVAPQEFAYPEAGLDIWSPFRWRTTNRTAPWFRRAHFIWPVARLRSQAGADEANAELEVLAAALRDEYPATNEHMTAGAVQLSSWIVGDRRAPLLLLGGAVVAMLLAACANVANLLLLRTGARRREMAVRSALGASRGRILRQLFTENLGLAILGGGGGALLAVALMPALLRLGADAIPRAQEVAIDGRTLLFASAGTLLTGLLFGLAPVAQGSLSRLRDALSERSADGGPRSAWMRQCLAVVEVALAVVLVTGAGLLLRSLERLNRVDPGFEPSGLLVAEINLGSANRYPDGAAINGFIGTLRERLEAHPDIDRVSFADWLPIGGPGWTSDFFVDGYDVLDPVTEFNRRYVDHQYLETMRVPLLRGRGFTAADGVGDAAESVVLVNESLVRRYFGDDDPIGRRVRFSDDDDDPWFRIVGVVGSEKLDGLDSREWPEILQPLAQAPNWGMSVLIRQGEGAARADAIFRDELAALDATVPIVDLAPFQARIGATLARERLLAVIGSSFALITLLLAALGVYGLLAQSVSQRRREIGIRMALGAASRQVVVAIVSRTLLLAGGGATVGAAGYVLASRWLRSLLFELEPGDPATLAMVSAVLIAAAIAAAWIPARRAARLDPATTLNGD